jgi:two-component system cell cycle sensor histidine kinase/response regulator CckA
MLTRLFLTMLRIAETGGCSRALRRFQAILGVALLSAGASHAAETAPASTKTNGGGSNARDLHSANLTPVVVPALAVILAIAGAFWWQRRLLRTVAEQAAKLRESEERLRRVLDGTEDGFWDWDMRSGRIERSERWASMLGYSLEEIGPTLDAAKSLVHPDDLAHFEKWQKRLSTVSKESRFDLEYRCKAKSGEWRWILDRGKVVERAPDGTPLRMAGTHTDITERKRTEAALHESQTLLRRSAQLLEQSQKTAHVGGWETDLRTGRVYWTAETYRIHETTPDEFTPTRDSIFAFYVPESRQRLMAAAGRAAGDGTPYSLELELVTTRGRRLFVHTAGVADMDNGKVVKLYGSFRDITSEKIAEFDREHIQLKMLEAQKLESLGVLAGGIAHDFNNLLTVILANATFLRGERGGQAEQLAHIESAARRAADLCRQMLAYAGKGSFLIAPVDVGALVADTTELIHVSISKKARLSLALAPHLPPVDGDASQLRQVVMNLVINASEALGDVPGDIRIATLLARPEELGTTVRHAFDLRAGECVCLEISDTGSGMTPATLGRIFDPFFTTKFAGRGLGLAAVLGIVRAHHGAMTVDSTPGKGSTFRIFLPVSLRYTTPDLPPPLVIRQLPQGGTILVADDEPIVLETAAALLRHSGFETVCAADGNEAVQRFRESSGAFLAVLLDLTMPGLDGAEALRVIRGIDPLMPALVMSGFSEQDVFARLRGLGQVAIVRKPFTRELLLERLAEVVGK